MEAKERPGAVASAHRAEKLIRQPHYEFNVSSNSPSPRDFQAIGEVAERIVARLQRQRELEPAA